MLFTRCKTDSEWEPAIRHGVLCDDLDEWGEGEGGGGRKVQEAEYTCIHTAYSFSSTAEADTIL